MKTTNESLLTVLSAAETAMVALGGVMKERHFLVGVGDTDGKGDLYFAMVRVEANLYDLIEKCKQGIK